MTKADHDGAGIEHGVTHDDVRKAFDATRRSALSSAQLRTELSEDEGDVDVGRGKVRGDGSVGRVTRNPDGGRRGAAFVWWPTVAPRLSLHAVERTVHARRLEDEAGTVPLEDPNGHVMENGRTVSAVRERLGDASSSVQEEFGRRIREMDTDPGAHLLGVLRRSEYVLKTAEYRAVGEWDHASYLFDVLHIGHRSRVYA